MTNPTGIDAGPNPGLRDEMSATKTDIVILWLVFLKRMKSRKNIATVHCEIKYMTFFVFV
jgi:hypothetical protein